MDLRSYADNNNSSNHRCSVDPGDIVTDGSFTYWCTVSDGNGGTLFDTATITITIIGKTDAPVADNETGSVTIQSIHFNCYR